MQVGIVSALQLGVDVPVRSILSAAVGTDVRKPSLYTVAFFKVLHVFEFREASGHCSFDEGVFGTFAAVSATGDVDWSAITMEFRLTTAVIVLELGTG